MPHRIETAMARRSFLASMALGVPIATSADFFSERLPANADPGDAHLALTGSSRRRAPGDFPQNEPSRVQAVVGASHGNFDRVRELVSEQPALAKASWDWGFGDWETALGAASHTGRRQIAEFLIGHGARPTVFSAAMLGRIDTVRAFLSADPELHRLHGPHGISLHRHALAGGDEAQDVTDYLLDRFGPDEEPVGVAGDETIAARYTGRYRFETEPPAVMSAGVRNDWLMVGTGEQPTSRVLQVGDDTFHPTGAPAVRLRFEVVGGRAERLTIEDGPLVIAGRRVE